MMLISGSWAAGDISQVAYLQSTISEQEDEVHGVNHLAAVMSFLYSCYIILSTFIVFGLSQAVDRFSANGTPQFGFMTICIVLSVISFVICIIYLLFAKIKPTKEEENEETMQSESQTQEKPIELTTIPVIENVGSVQEEQT